MLLLHTLLLLLAAVLVIGGTGTAVACATPITASAATCSRAAAILFRLALYLLHLGTLILEPHLHHAHRQPRVLGQRLAHLAARLGRLIERGLELLALLRGQYGAWSLGTTSSVTWSQQILLVEANEAAMLCRRCREEHLLLQVMAIAEELPVAQHELFALLQRQPARVAHEAGQMENIVGNGPHHQLLRQDGVAAGGALDSEEAIVVQLAVELRVAHVARVVQLHAAVAAGQALLVPIGIAHVHQITVVYLLAASLAQLVVLLALYVAHFCRENKRERGGSEL